MNNELFLIQMANQFDSLKYFKIENNTLILNFNGLYKIPFTNVSFANLNPNLFLLNPNEIFHILYMLELLPKNSLNDNEKNFINSYVNRYLSLNDLALENKEIDTNLVWCLSIPIYTSYDPENLDKESSKLIQDIVNNHSELVANSKGNHQKLVLTILILISIRYYVYIQNGG